MNERAKEKYFVIDEDDELTSWDTLDCAKICAAGKAACGEEVIVCKAICKYVPGPPTEVEFP